MNEQNSIQTLLQLCWPTLIELDGAIFITGMLPPNGPCVDDFFDRTAAETFYNHIHLLDMLQLVDLTSLNAALSNSISAVHIHQTLEYIAFLLVDMWRTKLRCDFPHYRFRLYVTRDDEPIIRFHRVRDGEPGWLDPADWTEQIASGSIAIYDTDAE